MDAAVRRCRTHWHKSTFLVAADVGSAATPRACAVGTRAWHTERAWPTYVLHTAILTAVEFMGCNDSCNILRRIKGWHGCHSHRSPGVWR